MPPSVPLRPTLFACSLSIALVGCSTSAQPGSRATRFLSIQPIQVCDDFGFFCADLAPFEAATRQIWAQADIEVSFLAPNRLFDSRYLTIDSRNEFADISFGGGRGAFGRNPLSTRNSGPISLWFVEEIVDGLFDVFGLAWVDQNGIVISDNILDFNRGIGRTDTVAHEIGHNLGLTHSNFGAGSSTNLMSSGGVRAIPSSLGDIAPEGPLSRLNNEQVRFARGSSLVTAQPEFPDDPPPFTLPPIQLPFLDGDGLADYDATMPMPTIAALEPPLPATEEEVASRFRAVSADIQPVPEPGGLGMALGLLLWGLRRHRIQRMERQHD